MSKPAPAPVDLYLQRAFALGSSASAQDLYNEWAAGYDKDLNSASYASPRRCVEVVLRALSSTPSSSSLLSSGSNDKNSTSNSFKTLRILDAGCGTGLVGECFARSPLGEISDIDGVDLSTGMLDVARAKGVYRDLETADLNVRNGIKREDAEYDVVVCVGTLTKGHVGPAVFKEFVRLVKGGGEGLVVATVHGGVWEDGGYRAEVERLEKDGEVRADVEEFGIVEGESSSGKMVVLRRC
ncbi:class I SAM-dependent DNA methyltransferase [Aspergillus puulaauensis]|uniref:Methyltransferase domain-containing protein n=1 Tax=Aspergillus puulaauensis TaxID=1220207 RepID=A0A7R7XIZ9_9EURO|nr:uncharacterized protein APUU_30606A [Aspergillus puulaauensis]BCS22381.1 hypothetical protein APUU_30606A [Aspergillus puulaauensis]